MVFLAELLGPQLSLPANVTRTVVLRFTFMTNLYEPSSFVGLDESVVLPFFSSNGWALTQAGSLEDRTPVILALVPAGTLRGALMVSAVLVPKTCTRSFPFSVT